MKSRLIGITFLLIAAVGFTLVRAQSVNPVFACTGAFEAALYQGPDKGLSLTGDLTIQVDNGSATGKLVTKDGKEIALTGQVNGRAISLAFDMGSSQYLFGVGSSVDDFSNCTKPAGGPLVGPQPGDSGDWGYAIGGKSGKPIKPK